MGTVVLVIVLAAAAAGYAYYNYVREQGRRAAAQTAAAARGFVVDFERKDPPPLGFDLFDEGHSKRVTYHTWRAGHPDNVFHYEYTTGSGKEQQTHRWSCALVEVPFTAPHLKIGPEGFWSAIGRAIGIRDIEIESPEFNDRYRVACDDERFAITLLDHETIAWLVSATDTGEALRFELGGRWLLFREDRVEYEQLFGLLEHAQAIRARLPEVLTSLYPPR